MYVVGKEGKFKFVFVRRETVESSKLAIPRRGFSSQRRLAVRLRSAASAMIWTWQGRGYDDASRLTAHYSSYRPSNSRQSNSENQRFRQALPIANTSLFHRHRSQLLKSPHDFPLDLLFSRRSYPLLSPTTVFLVSPTGPLRNLTERKKSY